MRYKSSLYLASTWLALAGFASPAGSADVIVRNRPGLDGVVEYVMACRTGRGMERREFRHTVPPNTVYPVIVIDFQRASASSRTASPAHGECAWLDRPISAEEPAVLVFNTRTFGWAFPDRYSYGDDYESPRYHGTVMLREWADLEAALGKRRTIFYAKVFRATRPFEVDNVRGLRPINLGTNYFEITGVIDMPAARRP